VSSSRRWISILWPGFLLACLLELLVFALVDPADLWWGGEGVGWSRQAIYTISFFVFWALAAASAALTSALLDTPRRQGITPKD
jgi:hypothetical protein